jgi:hypothetical protein
LATHPGSRCNKTSSTFAISTIAAGRRRAPAADEPHPLALAQRAGGAADGLGFAVPYIGMFAARRRASGA